MTLTVIYELYAVPGFPHRLVALRFPRGHVGLIRQDSSRVDLRFARLYIQLGWYFYMN